MDTVDNGGLLILVYPRGKTEFYDRPVAVREIMDRHPKHCITKTDVFKAPGLVVSPESILMPGKQFFVVPKYTIRELLKKRGTHKSTKSSEAAPASKESPNTALKRSATIHPDQQNVNREPVSVKRSSGRKLGCMPLASQSMAKVKVSSKLLLSSFSKINKIKELHAPYFHFTRTQRAHPVPPPQPPKIHLPDQAHSSPPPYLPQIHLPDQAHSAPPPYLPQIHPTDQALHSHVSAKTNRKVSFRLPTAEDIIYYTPVRDSPERDVYSATPPC